MSWYDIAQSNRLEKLARRFNLGAEIQKEIEELVRSIVYSMVLNGVRPAFDSPNKDLLQDEPYILSFPTEEFLSINRINESRLSDQLNMEVIPTIKYTTEEDSSSTAEYIVGKSVMILRIQFNRDDLNQGPNSFARRVSEDLIQMSYHEIVHFIKERLGLYKEDAHYTRPEDDMTQYVYQDIERENHLSDLHNFLLNGIEVLVQKMHFSISYILETNNFPVGQSKKKILSRIYNTIQEMSNYYKDTPYSKAIVFAQNALIAALKNDEDLIMKNLKQFQESIWAIYPQGNEGI